jgi:hypothetical protein
MTLVAGLPEIVGGPLGVVGGGGAGVLLVDPATVSTWGPQAPSAKLASATDTRSGNRTTADDPDRNFRISIRNVP